MKIRLGFVSNSSSSSFVLVGVDLNKEGIDESMLAGAIEKGATDLKEVIEESDDFYEVEEVGLFGINLFRVDEDGFFTYSKFAVSLDINETIANLKGCSERVKAILVKAGYPNVEVKLFGGIHSS